MFTCSFLSSSTVWNWRFENISPFILSQKSPDDDNYCNCFILCKSLITMCMVFLPVGGLDCVKKVPEDQRSYMKLQHPGWRIAVDFKSSNIQGGLFDKLCFNSSMFENRRRHSVFQKKIIMNYGRWKMLWTDLWSTCRPAAPRCPWPAPWWPAGQSYPHLTHPARLIWGQEQFNCMFYQFLMMLPTKVIDCHQDIMSIWSV